MFVLRLILGAALTLAVTWFVFVVALAIFRPKGINLSEAKRLVPDIVRLVRALAKDYSLSSGVQRRLSLLLVYLALPIDLVPDFIPLLGYADDVIVLALVLRSVVRRAGPSALDRHWSGTPHGWALVRSLSGLR